MSKTNQDPFIVSSLCIEALLNLGVQDFVLCAGSRNAPIIETLTKAADGTNKETNEEVKRDIALYSHFEERSASHFALGVAVRKKKAVCIVCTSGTAVAEILPACIEAYYRGIILIVLSADRPSRYRGSGAPQCIEQENVFGLYCERLEFDDLCKISQDSGEKTRSVSYKHLTLPTKNEV